MKTIYDFMKKKQAKQKISMVTCYDYTSACIIEKTAIDCILVGDSASMVMLGHDNTTHTVLDEIVLFTKAAARGAKNKFIIADLPFMSYRRTLTDTVNTVTQLIQAGAQAVKLEGAAGNTETVRFLVESGIPVMGHIGLTPQSIHGLGGFNVQGKTTASYRNLIQQAEQLTAAGCFTIVLECMPWQLAQEITQRINIPTIGIGAGAETDGQVLVFQDLLGLYVDFKPKFVKQYLPGAELFTKALNQFAAEIQAGHFPQSTHCYEGVTS